MAKLFPVWNDEADARWLIATFLRSDIGFSAETACDILQAFDSLIAGRRDAFRWDGNSFTLQATRHGCSLEVCDSDVPSQIRPVSLPLEELREIVDCWKKQLCKDAKPAIDFADDGQVKLRSDC